MQELEFYLKSGRAQYGLRKWQINKAEKAYLFIAI
jgi:hypothetical protein